MRWTAALVLAISEDAVQPRRAGCDLYSKGEPVRSKFAKIAGGAAMSMLPEILFDVPGTAHCIGGCVMADSPDRGVVDSQASRLWISQYVHLRWFGVGERTWV